MLQTKLDSDYLQALLNTMRARLCSPLLVRPPVPMANNGGHHDGT